jgi:phospholipase/carboxylesterase
MGGRRIHPAQIIAAGQARQIIVLHTELIPAAEPRAGGARPLMVMLHGLGDSIEGYRWLPEAMKLPWLNYLLVNAPDSYYEGYSWFDLNNPAPGVARSRRLLFNLLDDLPGGGFPPEQTTVGGFSQGCLMALEAALRYPHRFAGVVGISGWVYETDKLQFSSIARQQRILMTHGLHDPLIPIAAVRQQIPILKSADIHVEWREFAKDHTIAGEQELSVIREFVRAGYAAK